MSETKDKNGRIKVRKRWGIFFFATFFYYAIGGGKYTKIYYISAI